MGIRIQCLCIDTADPARIASFWESALGWRRTWEEEDQVCLEPPEGSPEDGIAPDLARMDPAAAADAAWATSDTLHVAAAMLGSRVLRQAADAYDRAARSPYGHIPPPSPAGNQLRQAARLLSAFACITRDQSMAPLVLIAKLAALAEAVAELRQSQQHAAQATAALRAAERLHAAARPAPAAQPRAASPQPQPAPQHRAARRSVVSQASQGRPPATRTRSARPRPERPDAATSAAAATATRPQPLTNATITTTRKRTTMNQAHPDPSMPGQGPADVQVTPRPGQRRT